MRVAVAYGGVSQERPISLKTGRGVGEALRSRGHDVVMVDLQEERPHALLAAAADVVFLALHGRYGEDGQLAAELRARGLPCTGAPPEACRLAMDKIATRDALRAAGLQVARGAALPSGLRRIEELPDGLALPLVLKPAQEGSSLGVRMVEEPAGFAAALEEVRAFGDTVLCEERLAGREWTVGIVDGQVLPPILLEVPGNFFDYEAKYRDQRTRYVVDPPAEARAELLEAARRAAEAIGCQALCRVDLFETARGAVLLEVNTTPGMTERSLLPMAAAAAGCTYGSLCERLLQRALTGTPAWAGTRENVEVKVIHG